MMSPNDNVYKFEGYNGIIKIEPNWTCGYKTDNKENIICLTIDEGDEMSCTSIDLQTAKLMIEALQEIIDYVEDNI